MADWWWALASAPTGRTRGPVPPGGVYSTLAGARGRALTVRCDPDQSSEATFTIDGRSAEAADIDPLATDLVVRRDQAVLFRGRIAPESDTLDAGRHDAQFTAWSYRELLRRRNLMHASYFNWTSTDQATIVWSMVSYTQGQPGGYLGITQGTGTVSGVDRTVTYDKGDFIGDRISELAKMDDGFDWDVTPYGVSDLRLDLWHPERGLNRGAVLEYGGGLVSRISRSVDPGQYENAAYVTGDSSAGLTPVTIDAAGIGTAPEGRWEASIGVPVVTQSALDSRAAWEQAYKQVLVPSYQVELLPGAWGGPGHIWAGDYVRLRIRSGRLDVDTDLRVVELTVAPGDSGDEQVSLTLGRIRPPLPRRIASLLTRLSWLERR